MSKPRSSSADQVEVRLTSGDDRLLHRKALSTLRDGIRQYVAQGGRKEDREGM